MPFDCRATQTTTYAGRMYEHLPIYGWYNQPSAPNHNRILTIETLASTLYALRPSGSLPGLLLRK